MDKSLTTITDIESMRLQMKKINGMLVLVRRVVAESAVDTARMDWLEQSGAHIIEFQEPHARGIHGTHTVVVVDSLRKTIDGLIEEENEL